VLSWDGAGLEPVPAWRMASIRANVLAAVERRHARTVAQLGDAPTVEQLADEAAALRLAQPQDQP
jgi:hypothetical protein